MAVRLRLLGPPHVVDEAGRRHGLTLERPTALLVLLALRGDWVRRTELAALVRPDAADDEAHAYLRKLIFRARKQPWAGGVETEAGRLRWRVANDVAAFRDAVARADDPAALAAYGGPLLDGADLPAAEALRAWFDLERAELAAAWRAVVLRHAATREAAGDPAAAEASLERLRASDPLDEEAVQALVRLQLAAGRPRDAWTTFEALRRSLQEELGVAPLEATRALADLARPAASGTPPPTAPATADIPAAGPDVAARVLGAPPVDGPLVGRAEELERVARWWARGDVRWVTLAGLGGAGKTRLAIEIARGAAAERLAAFVACAGRAGVDDVATALAEALEVDVGGRAAPREALAAWWRDRRALLVLDDLDGELAPGVAEWLAASPSVVVVATARAPLHLPGEWLVDVGGLAVPAEDAADAAASEAVRLFLALAERRAAVPVSGHDGLAAVASLCRRVDGLPLALELAAAWTRVAPVEALLARMDEDVAALRVAAPDLPARHRDLVAVVDATLDLLDDRERAALGALAAIATPFGAGAAMRVAEVGLARLLRYVNLGLVGRSAEGSYRLHPFVREVAWRRVPEDARALARAAVRRHAAAVVSAAAEDMLRRDEAGGLRALRAELDVLRAAWRDALDAGDAATVAAMEEGLYLAWDARAAYHEGFDTFAHAAAVAGAWSAANLARRLQARAGYFALRLGRTDEARRRLAEALDGASGADAAFVVHNLGVLDLFAGRHAAARARFVDAHERYEALGDAWGTSRAANNLSALGQFTGDMDGSEAWGRRALEECRALGNQRGIAAAANNLGSVLEARGAWDEAERAYREALALYAAVGDPRGEAAAWTNLGHLAERRGDDAAAAAAYEHGLQLKRTLGDPIVVAVSLANLADVCVRRGEAPRARAMVREALRIAVAAGADVYLARALLTHARERAHAGDHDEAMRVAAALAAFPTAEAWVRAEAEAASARWAPHLPAAGSDAAGTTDPRGALAAASEDVGADAGAAIRVAVARALADAPDPPPNR